MSNDANVPSPAATGSSAGTAPRPRLTIGNLISFALAGFALGLIAGFARALLGHASGAGQGNMLPFGLAGAGVMLVVGPVIRSLSLSGRNGDRVARFFVRLIVLALLGFYVALIVLEFGTS